jgi:hypothetical protein
MLTFRKEIAQFANYKPDMPDVSQMDGEAAVQDAAFDPFTVK